MGRKTYDPRAGRRRPVTFDGLALARIEQDMRRAAPGPPAPRGATHRPDCPGAQIVTFVGRLGDEMGYCRNCKTTRPTVKTGDAA